MRCRIAELNIEINNTDSDTERICSKFLCDFDKPDLVISVSPLEVKKEMEASTYKNSFAYTESFLSFKKLSSRLAEFDAFLMHGAVIKIRNKGIVFSAPSGTGKTTHMLRWKEVFGDEVTVINGDKPIIRQRDGHPVAYGTPWCGKEGYTSNDSVNITDICFIERAEQNSVCRVEARDAVKELMSQILIPKVPADTIRVLGMLDDILKECSVWKIYCNKDIEAALVASEEIFKVRGNVNET